MYVQRLTIEEIERRLVSFCIFLKNGIFEENMKNAIFKIMLIFVAKIHRLIRGEISTRRLIKRGLKVGKNFGREGGVRIDSTYCFLIEIGDNVTLAPDTIILAHDASLKYFLGVSRLGQVIIGNNVFVGAKTIILPNVKIGNNVVIGAGSVVRDNIPNNSVWAGNPAKFLCTIEEFISKNQTMFKGKLLGKTYDFLNIPTKEIQMIKNEVRDGYIFVKCNNYDSLKQFKPSST